MITLEVLLKETGINRNTLAKYRDLGLLPKPEIIHQGNGKVGRPRGNQALYPDYTPWLIQEITRLKSKPYYYGLSQIRDKIEKIEKIVPETDISEPLKSYDMKDIADATLRISSRLNELSPNCERFIVSYKTNAQDGTITASSIWGIK